VTIVWLLRVAAVAIGLAGWGSLGAQPLSTAGRAQREPQLPRASRLSRAAVARRSLSVEQLAGQRVIYSYSGLVPPASLISQIRAGDAAGVIFFADNISSEEQIRRVIATLQRAAAQSPVTSPLLLMTDQEGGDVRRLPGAPLRSEKQIGASPRSGIEASQAGRGAGLNLKSVGINVNLAPVLDVYRRSGNFIDQYGRSYSSNPRTVARLGADFIRAQQKTGVAATAKHFPGLGAASAAQDTDTRPVTLDVPLAELRSIDELPYESAIPARVKLVMVSWATYPALDPHHPAGLSATVIHGELRQRLRFTGVAITDALGAGALSAYGPTSSRAVLAARAGMDLLLCASQNAGEGTAAVRALATALNRGRLSASGFTASVNRVLALRRALT
jgi:beta-N-acetylhexosaminidase